MARKKNRLIILEKASFRVTKFIGTPLSVFIHTLVFLGAFSLRFVGVRFDDILLVLTTLVSLEAIYLSIFIQMSVNKTAESLEAVGDDIEDIQEDVEDISEDIQTKTANVSSSRSNLITRTTSYKH